MTTMTGCLDLPGDQPVLVGARLVYRPWDCLAVTMVLAGPDGVEVEWTFGWELLSRGLLGPAGEGDVLIRPVRAAVPVVEVVLATSFGARIRFPARNVGYFVSRVRARAAADTVHISRSLDAELAAITDGRSPAEG